MSVGQSVCMFLTYLCLLWSLYFDSNQIQILVVQSFCLAGFPLLLAPALAASLFLVVFILIGNEALALPIR